MKGPSQRISNETHAEKYRLAGESFEQLVYRLAAALNDGESHRLALKYILGEMRFLPAGRIQNAIGSPRATTGFNCFVSSPIEDSMSSIMQRAAEAAETMRRGGGIGFDFSEIRPRGELISSLGSRASGPISFMHIFDAVCSTIKSAGHRRGAMMGVLRCDHPDIEKFVMAKQTLGALTGFNVSVGITDEFMRCLGSDEKFPLRFEGRTFEWIDPQALWDMIMRSTWDFAEPGVIFLDTVNRMNNLWYCEKIAATNPCGEQPLPPAGACLLGSFNLVKYITGDRQFDYKQLENDIPHVVRAMDNVNDRTVFPLEAQKREAQAKRRMGLGVTGLANAGEILSKPYASAGFLNFTSEVLRTIAECSYVASSELAHEKGSFPAFDREKYLQSESLQKFYARGMTAYNLVARYGIRNSHLTSIAPTGTISLCADNVSSGIEPPFRLRYDREIVGFDDTIVEEVTDYAFREFGVRGKTANQLSAQEHLSVLATAQQWVDSAVSKTCNVGSDVSFSEFRSLYYDAWKLGCKGLTTFREDGKRSGILRAKEDESCRYDPETGVRTCE